MDNRIFKYLRIAYDYNITDLSKRLGVSRQYITRIENGEQKPSENIINSYCKIFRISRNAIELLSDETNREEKEQGSISCQKILLSILEVILGKKDIDGNIQKN